MKRIPAAYGADAVTVVVATEYGTLTSASYDGGKLAPGFRNISERGR